MSAAPKLTKKQKKSLAFRLRKQGAAISKDVPDDETNDVPAIEDQDLADVQDGDGQSKTVDRRNGGKGKGAREGGEDWTAKDSSNGKGKEKERERGDTEHVVDKAKKRKRAAVSEDNAGADNDASTEIEKPKRKKKKGSVDDGEGLGAEGKKVKSDTKQRFILFVGNLKYTTSLETIKQHFASCDPPPVIRLGTLKPSTLHKPTAKSKGYAFLEFSHRNALQQALKLHQSDIDGRRINVELTAGGGGNSQSRLSKLKTRNKELDEQRRKKVEQHAASGSPGNTILLAQPQRYSATSGLEHVPTTKRTWTVGGSEGGAPCRGGRKHAKKEGRSGRLKERMRGTGVNAIPVG